MIFDFIRLWKSAKIKAEERELRPYGRTTVYDRITIGEPFDEQIQNEILDSLKPAYVQGITLLGGDPFEEENQEALVPFMRRVKERYPNKDVWAYTGYLYEELLENGRKHTEYTDELLSMIDVLVDGPFIEEQKDITLKFKGSANQRVIDMEKTRATGEVAILEFTKI